MIAWIFPVCLLIICIWAVAFFRYRGNVTEINRRVRKMATLMMSFSAVCCVAAVVFITTLAYSSEFFTSVLSSDFIADSRVILKVVFGSESVFTSLQMLGALSLFVFSFASCAIFVFYFSAVLLRNIFGKGNGVGDCSENEASLIECVSVKRFALLSRYLL